MVDRGRPLQGNGRKRAPRDRDVPQRTDVVGVVGVGTVAIVPVVIHDYDALGFIEQNLRRIQY